MWKLSLKRGPVARVDVTIRSFAFLKISPGAGAADRTEVLESRRFLSADRFSEQWLATPAASFSPFVVTKNNRQALGVFSSFFAETIDSGEQRHVSPGPGRVGEPGG